MTFWLAGVLVVLSGAAIGATSIGGVLLVPALSGLGDLPVADAVAASSLAFALTGLMAWSNAREARPSSPAMMLLHCAALLGALAGAALVHAVSPSTVRIWVALISGLSGVFGLLPSSVGNAQQRFPGGPVLCAIGLTVGCGSALSGTGGPVLMLPLLMLLRLPMGDAVSVAQTIQLPIALAASTMHGIAGSLPMLLGLEIGIALLFGAWAGRALARRAKPSSLRMGVSLALIAIGFWYGIQ